MDVVEELMMTVIEIQLELIYYTKIRNIINERKNILFDSSPAVNCFSTAICCRSLTISRGGAKSAATEPRRLFDIGLAGFEVCSKLSRIQTNKKTDINIYPNLHYHHQIHVVN